MRLIVFITVSLILSIRLVYPQQYQVTGIISDSLTKETLPGATVFNLTTSSGTISSADGEYRLYANEGIYQLRISYIGYRTKTISIVVTKDMKLDIVLITEAVTADAVVVTADNPAGITENLRTGFVRLTAADLSQVPVLMGEPDLIRALHYSPGFQSSGDGNSGFYVRGGNVDQNLILMDNAVIYNPSHILGFFSVFNSDVIGSATLIKSGIPANYGGRLSSVLSVITADGDFEKHHLNATAGLLYSKATINGPLVKNRLSCLVSFRKTYINELIKPLAGMFDTPGSSTFLDGSLFGMYDLNLKLTGILNDKNRIGISLYKGCDHFRLNLSDKSFRTRIDWGNGVAVINWNSVLSDSSYLLNSLSYSSYEFQYDASQFIMNFDLYSSIRNINYKIEYNRETHLLGSLKGGAETKYYRFVPNRFMLNINETDLNYSSHQSLYAGEFAAFFSVDKDITERTRISAGVRAGNYRHFGPYKLISQPDGLIRDTTSYNPFETIQSYSGLEPRVSIRYQTSANSSIKLSYTRNYQYIHIASASSVTLPSDIWIPSTSSTAPQYGDQFTAGYYRNFMNNAITASTEVYYKGLSNQVELLYGLGASLQDVSFENSLATGKGSASGIEFFLQKNDGRLTGSAAYSLSYSERQFKEINNGDPFPAKYDRRHEINFTAAYRSSERWEFSAAFIYATGNALTVPVQIYLFNNNINTEYSKTNAFRMPPYHRLDLSATWMIKKTSRSESNLNFTLMNVYNRANPFLIYFDIEGDILNEHSLAVTARQISIFPILPSVSWSFKF